MIFQKSCSYITLMIYSDASKVFKFLKYAYKINVLLWPACARPTMPEAFTLIKVLKISLWSFEEEVSDMRVFSGLTLSHRMVLKGAATPQQGVSDITVFSGLTLSHRMVLKRAALT